jgi:hypothetical protein
MTGMAVVMQWVRAEDPHLDLVALVIPLWMVAFPALCLVAAVAVLFECTPFLRSGAGNVVYFFLYMAVLVAWIEGADGEIMKTVNDPFGISYVIADMQHVIKAHDPDYNGQVIIGGAEFSTDPLIFTWEGMAWTTEMILGRLFWIGIAVLLALVAALPFDRFDPARARMRRRARTEGDEIDATPSPTPGSTLPAHERGAPAPPVHLTPLAARRFRPRLGGVLLAELRLILAGRRWWWYAMVIGLNIAGLAVPDATVRQYLHAAAWFWPILLWSSMGNRERSHNTQQIVFSVAHPLGRQLSAVWLSGVCVAAAASAGFALRQAFTGQWDALGAWAAGVLFVPSLALALGTWSGSRRAFEVIYTFLWYIGPINRVPALDYAGLTPQAAGGGFSPYYVLASVALLGLALVGRWRQMQR